MSRDVREGKRPGKGSPAGRKVITGTMKGPAGWKWREYEWTGLPQSQDWYPMGWRVLCQPPVKRLSRKVES